MIIVNRLLLHSVNVLKFYIMKLNKLLIIFHREKLKKKVSMQTIVQHNKKQTIEKSLNSVDGEFLKAMSIEVEEGSPDMARMSELNESTILANLNTRYKKNEIYVSCVKFNLLLMLLKKT